MGTKTKSLGLSSLVVTSLDRGASVELTANGWPVYDQPQKLSQIQYRGVDTTTPSRQVVRAAHICQQKTKDDTVISINYPRISAVVRKASVGWRRTWNKRLLVLDERGLCLYKNENAKNAYKSILIEKIVRLDIGSQKQSRDPPCVLTVEFQAGRDPKLPTQERWQLAFNTQGELSQVRSLIATFGLINEIEKVPATTKDAGRLLHLINDCGAQLEYKVSHRTPLLLFSLYNSRFDIMKVLLRKGVDARCLLRVDRRIRSLISANQVMELLEDTNRDLNLVGDDDIDAEQESMNKLVLGEAETDGWWSLAHHFVVLRDVESLTNLVKRVDKPTLNIKTNAGETALSLALRRISEFDETEAGLSAATAIVRVLLEHGADPNAITSTGDTPFHLTCKRPLRLCGDIFNLFEKNTAIDLNLSDGLLDSPLPILMKLGHNQLAKRLAQDPRVNIDQRDGWGILPIVHAMRMNEESFACMLLNRGAKASLPCLSRTPSTHQKDSPSKVVFTPGRPGPNAMLNEEEQALSQESPLHRAIKLHLTSFTLKCVEKLPLKDLTSRDAEGRTPLLLSILHSLLGISHALVTRFVQENAKHLLNEQDERTGDSPIQLAIRAGRVELTQALMDAGADLGVRNLMGETTMHVCARFVERTYNSSGGYAALRLFTALVACDAKRGPASCINVLTYPVDKVVPHMRPSAERLAAKTSRKQMGAQSVLHQAAASVNEQCGLWLLDALFESPVLAIDLLDDAGMTPLACAIQARNAEICRLLLPKTNINKALGSGGDSYLHLVLKEIQNQASPKANLLIPIVENLLYQNAFCGMWDETGYTVLHMASSHEQFLPVLTILLRNSDVLTFHLNDRTEKEGWTPLMIAVRHSKSPVIVGMLLEAGVDVRLLEPHTRKGVFQMCLEEGFDSHPENLGIAVKLLQMVDESRLLPGSDEAKARKELAEKHSALRSASEGISLLNRSRDFVASPHRWDNDAAISSPSSILTEQNKHMTAHNSSSSMSWSPRAGSQEKRPFERVNESENSDIVNQQGSLRNHKRFLDQQHSANLLQNRLRPCETEETTVTHADTSTAATFVEEDQDVDEKTGDFGAEITGEHDDKNGEGSLLGDEEELNLISSGEGNDSSEHQRVQRDADGQVYQHRLSQLDHILTLERVRSEAMQNAKSWLECDAGKMMMAQSASVLVSQSEEHMTHEAALALAKRNFVEHQIQENVEAFEASHRRKKRSELLEA